MYKKILILLAVLVAAGSALSGVELVSFRVFPVVDHSQLEWETGQEVNLRQYVVERSADAENFMSVGQVQPKGSFSQYSFTDSSPLDLDMNRTFYYRLKMVDRDGTIQYSEVREVSLTFNAVQQTWGTIKAMFR